MKFLRSFILALFASGPLAFAQNSTPAPDLASNPAPQAGALNPALPTIFIAGDSTAAKGRGETQQGWGVPFADYFDPAKVNVANRARGGRSSKTFILEGAWDQILTDVKAGDIVLIQFGHNDGSPVAENESVPRRNWRFRGTLPGLGDETQEIDNPLTNNHETVHTFGWYIRKMVDDVKAKGASPVVLSPTVRNMWTEGRIERGPGRYGPWSYEVAKAANVPFVDVSNAMADKFQAMGQEETKKIFQQDHTHFNAVGADLHAAAVVASLKGWRPNLVEKFLSAKGEAVPAERTAWLRLPSPSDPKLPSLFLAGDSTVRNDNGSGSNGQWGWGDYLGRHFDLAKINVVNRAVGGTGVQTFHDSDHWRRIMAMVKPGDFVMIQFGHNDNGARGPLPGIGEETGERENPRTKEKSILHTWGWYLRQEIAEVRAKGATPIVCSLVPRKIWKDGKIQRNKDAHAGWAEQVAASEHVAFLDLNELIAQRYDALGEAGVNPLFADAHTHTTGAGAELNADVVTAALRALPENPLAPYLRANAP
jgi:lysophospholipase L1-like esterase